MPGGDAGLPQPALEPLRRWDPEQIGGYVLVGRLGAGAMGRVYLGRSAAGRLVAVKTIRVELAEEPGFRNRFAQEVAAARRVSGAFKAESSAFTVLPVPVLPSACAVCGSGHSRSAAAWRASRSSGMAGRAAAGVGCAQPGRGDAALGGEAA
jgi:hypothetical protein